ncbi:hypothetical protein GCM10014715_75750 [Streptomyces spiralis]|uniref:Uncharacterized protein n=1 Tax=Streptomyces spiralis TaxID=66376 RepID=A0A919AIJ0_9ACTN|nr:hypothetical protein GCM10014715_75750 [Streptomyces spiralis]
MVLSGASPYHRRSHTSVTNYADPLGPRGPDLHLRTRPGLKWTPKDGLYNLCQVGPQQRARQRSSEGRIRAGGPRAQPRNCRADLSILHKTVG